MRSGFTYLFLAVLLGALALSGCDSNGPVYCDTSADCAPNEDCTFFYKYRAQICARPCQTDEDCPSGQTCEVGEMCGTCDDDGCMTCPMSVNGCIP